jgi:hypothetical protein
MRVPSATFLLLAIASFSGCRGVEGNRPTDGGTACTAFGQRCEYAPGKLGACVKRDDCTGNDCFVCQSQH